MKNALFAGLMALFACLAGNLVAGTIIFKDGSSLSGVTLVSISDGRVVIEKSKVRKTYPLNSIKSYYNTNVGGEGNGPDKYAKYKVHVIDMKVPKKGVNSKGKTSVAELDYSVEKTGPEKVIRVPYAYLYVLTRGKDEYKGRETHFYCMPTKHAKPRKSKGYDEAAIMARVLDFGRPTWGLHRKDLHGGLKGRVAKFVLKGIGNRKILAWHLEIWGDKEKVVDKTEIVYPEAGVGKQWWKRMR